VALCIGLAATAHGTTITVNSTADSLAVDGNCTLREAIIAANTDTAVDACPAGSGADVVVVPAETYTLTLVGAGEDAAATGDLDVTADLEIDGAGAAATVIVSTATRRTACWTSIRRPPVSRCWSPG
jgi:CSLREA domain-containing protein